VGAANCLNLAISAFKMALISAFSPERENISFNLSISSGLFLIISLILLIKSLLKIIPD